MKFLTEFERGVKQPLLRAGGKQVQMIPSGAAAETVIHLSFQIDGKGPARG
jgi:hypothetical protein